MPDAAVLVPEARARRDEGRVAAIRRHIEARFEAARLEQFPFPHLIIPGIFPDAIFADMLRFNLFADNRGSEWKTRAEQETLRTPTPYDHRRQINFHAADPYVASEEARTFWTMITRVFLAGPWFLRLVYAKFPAYFDLRFGEAVARADIFDRLRTELFLQRHEPGYHIGPHTDIPTRVFTCIFALADRPGFESFGTQLLRPVDPLARCSGRQHHPFDGFEVAKVAPYAPNSFLLFFKTRQSFHAVRTITPDVPNARYGMQYQCYEPGSGMFRDLSHPDLLASKLRKDAI